MEPTIWPNLKVILLSTYFFETPCSFIRNQIPSRLISLLCLNSFLKNASPQFLMSQFLGDGFLLYIEALDNIFSASRNLTGC